MNFLFDNNLPPALVKALRLLDKRVSHVREVQELGAAAPDPLILDHAANWDYVLVTTDRAMRKTAHFQALIKARKLGVVFVRTGAARQIGSWEIAKLLVKAWDDIERFASSHHKPFMALVNHKGRVTRV
jgi:predicted nuclease of predicted toxin-antitoxin system